LARRLLVLGNVLLMSFSENGMDLLAGHMNPRQMKLTFPVDRDGGESEAARCLSCRLTEHRS